MAISRSSMAQQIDGKLRGAKKKKAPAHAKKNKSNSKKA